MGHDGCKLFAPALQNGSLEWKIFYLTDFLASNLIQKYSQISIRIFLAFHLLERSGCTICLCPRKINWFAFQAGGGCNILILWSILAIRRHRARNLSRLQFLLRESLKLLCNPPEVDVPKFLPFPVWKFLCAVDTLLHINGFSYWLNLRLFISSAKVVSNMETLSFDK